MTTRREEVERKIADAKHEIAVLELELARLPDVYVKGLTFGTYGKQELVVDMGGCGGYPQTIRVTNMDGGGTAYNFVRA